MANERSKSGPGRIESASSAVARRRDQRQQDFEIEFFDHILIRSPKLVDVLRVQGELLTHSGFHERALVVDRRLARLRPDDHLVHYNLACSLALLGQSKDAVNRLRQAIELGYGDFDYLEQDGDLDSLRDSADYRQLLEDYGVGQ